jgi:deoxyribose-phosphate aldolase
MDYTYESIARMIDHSLVNPTLTVDQLEDGLRVAAAYQVATVSIMPFYIARAAEALGGTGVKPGATVGFPHGSHATATKVAEAELCLREGAQELDMVCNVSQVLSGDWRSVFEDIQAVADVAHAAKAKLKVIFENCFLNDTQKIRLCGICGEAGADWLKTSTGYASGGATIEDLRLMLDHAPAGVQVKAAGGIRDLDALLKVRAMGVTRVGATRTAPMLDECRKRLGMEPLGLAVAVPAGY